MCCDICDACRANNPPSSRPPAAHTIHAEFLSKCLITFSQQFFTPVKIFTGSKLPYISTPVAERYCLFIQLLVMCYGIEKVSVGQPLHELTLTKRQQSIKV